MTKTTKKSAPVNLSRFIRNRKVIWYGPHECNGCGSMIVRSSYESGGIKLDAPHDHHYPNHRWIKHRCIAPEAPENPCVLKVVAIPEEMRPEPLKKSPVDLRGSGRCG